MQATTMVRTPLDRGLARVAHEARGYGTPCWLWQGALSGGGYGAIRIDGRQLRTHRVVYQALVGEIPHGLQLDHLCRIRHCCRPDHLEAVTGRVNLLRGATFQAANAAKSVCPQGHAYDVDYGDGARRCRTCIRAAGLRYRRTHLKAVRERQRDAARAKYALIAAGG